MHARRIGCGRPAPRLQSAPSPSCCAGLARSPVPSFSNTPSVWLKVRPSLVGTLETEHSKGRWQVCRRGEDLELLKLYQAAAFRRELPLFLHNPMDPTSVRFEPSIRSMGSIAVGGCTGAEASPGQEGRHECWGRWRQGHNGAPAEELRPAPERVTSLPCIPSLSTPHVPSSFGCLNRCLTRCLLRGWARGAPK